MIINEENVQITKREIYNTIYDYELPEGYHFESYGTKWGRHIFGEDKLSNHYIVKKDEINTKKDSE